MGGFAKKKNPKKKKNRYVGHDGPLPDHSTDGCAMACIESINTAVGGAMNLTLQKRAQSNEQGTNVCMLCAPFRVQSITSSSVF